MRVEQRPRNIKGIQGHSLVSGVEGLDLVDTSLYWTSCKVARAALVLGSGLHSVKLSRIATSGQQEKVQFSGLISRSDHSSWARAEVCSVHIVTVNKLSVAHESYDVKLRSIST